MFTPTALTLPQARWFLLALHGLAGPKRHAGAQGVMALIRQWGCLQFDPVDICGRSPDLSLFARVEGYDPGQLSALLYEQRALVEYFDKQLSILPKEDWPMFARTRAMYAAVSGPRMTAVAPFLDEYRALLRTRAPLSSRELEDDRRLTWLWGSESTLPRAALETLFYIGEAGVHHRVKNMRRFSPIDTLLPDVAALPDPFPLDRDWYRAMVVRRVGAIGLLWNRNSDGFLGIKGLTPLLRNRAFADALEAGELLPVQVEGIASPLYCRSRDGELLSRAAALPRQEPLPESEDIRAELLPPLDAFLWDRKLIKALFGLHYSWEIYTPAAKRVYGPYTMPVLCSRRFIGRADVARDSRESVLRATFWPEAGSKPTRAEMSALNKRLKALAAFNGVKTVQLTRAPAVKPAKPAPRPGNDKGPTT